MRRLVLCLGIALLSSPIAHAQVGGVIKKKAPSVPNVPGTTAPTTTAAAKPKCEASKLVITSDIVNRYLQSFAARDAEVQKLAKEPGATGAYYSALLKRQEIQKRKAEFDQQRGPDWDKQQAIQKRMMQGDTTAIKEYTALGASLEPSSVEIPPLSWDDQEKVQARIENAMKAGGKFTDCDWLDLGERLPRLVSILAENPNTTELQGYGTAAEAAAVRPKLPQLAAGMGFNYQSPEDKARKQKQAAAPVELPSTGDPQLDCVQRYQMAWTETHRAEIETAQKAQDTNAIMKINMQMQQEAMAKCMPPQ
jgi:hypothetical protein